MKSIVYLTYTGSDPDLVKGHNAYAQLTVRPGASTLYSESFRTLTLSQSCRSSGHFIEKGGHY